MVNKSRILAPIVEELIGIATMLIPEPKPQAPRISFEETDTDLTMSNIRSMKSLIADVKAKTTCPKCLKHCDTIEHELSELERKYPTYQRVNELRGKLRELLDLIRSEGELPILPEIAQSETKSPSS